MKGPTKPTERRLCAIGDIRLRRTLTVIDNDAREAKMSHQRPLIARRTNGRPPLHSGPVPIATIMARMPPRDRHSKFMETWPSLLSRSTRNRSQRTFAATGYFGHRNRTDGGRRIGRRSRTSAGDFFGLTSRPRREPYQSLRGFQRHP